MAVKVEGNVVASVDEMKKIAGKSENAGRTFHVVESVFRHFASQHRVLPNTFGDIGRINNLLGTNITPSPTFGMTRVAKCAACSHTFTLADQIESALMMGAHSAAELKNILTGDRFFLTVDTQKPREVQCPKCKAVSPQPHCCYVTDDYAYV